MKNKTILIPILIILMSISTLALITNISNYYTNTSINFTQLSTVSDVNGQQYILGQNTSFNQWLYINQTSGLFKSLTIINITENYGLEQYGSNIYLRHYGGSIGSQTLHRYNLSNGAETLMDNFGFATNTGNYFGIMLDKFYYSRTPTSANLNIFDITNGTQVVFFGTGYFDLSLTDCSSYTKIVPYGVDYDNNYYYFECINSSNGETGELVYIKSDYRFTKEILNNVALNETQIFSITNPQLSPSSQTNKAGYPQFMIINNNMYLINGSNRNQIVSSQYINEYAGLTCDYINGVFTCVNASNFCLHPFFTQSSTSLSSCSNTTFTGGLNNVINPIYASPIDMYCNNDITFCNLGCNNTLQTNGYGISYYEANCLEDTTCTNECFILGERKDLTKLTYSNCTTSTQDVCLHLETITCPTGTFVFGGICQAIDGNVSTTNKLSFSIEPNTNLGDGLLIPIGILGDYYPNEVPPRVFFYLNASKSGISTTMTSGIIPINLKIFSPDNSYFTAFTCDYQSLFSDYVLQNSTLFEGAQVEAVNINKTIILNGITTNKETLILMNNGSLTFILRISDILDNTIQQLLIDVNSTTGEITVYDNTTGNILNVFNYNPAINIGKFVVDLYQDNFNKQQNGMISIYSYINQNNQPIITTNGYSIIPYSDLSADDAYKIELQELNGELFIAGLKTEKISSIVNKFDRVFTSATDNFVIDYKYTDCFYATDDCKIMRTYISEKLGSQYFSFVDLKVCRDVKHIVNAKDNSGVFGGLDKSQKMIFALIVPLVVAMLFTIFGMIQHTDDEKKPLIWIGLFGFVALMLFFAVIGWLPVWILIMGAIIVSALIGIIFIQKTTGG